MQGVSISMILLLLDNAGAQSINNTVTSCIEGNYDSNIKNSFEHPYTVLRRHQSYDSYSLLLIHYSGIPRWLYMPHIKSMNKFDFFPWNVCRGGLSSILD